MLDEHYGGQEKGTAHMDDEAVRNRIDSLIRESGQGYAAISRLLGRNPAYMQQYIKRGVPRRLGESERRIVAQHFGVSEASLGALPPAPRQQDTPGPDDSVMGFQLIPYLDPRTGKIPDIDQPEMFVFDRAMAAQLALTGARHLAALTIEGDAMFPTLAAGDKILVDIGNHRGLQDGVYVLRTDAALLIKRLSVNPVTLRVSILSDNAAYPSFPDCAPEQINVIGRVRWVGRRLS